MSQHSQVVSVIVPIFAVEKYLPHCVDSLLTQTHRELEILLIDDGSPDASGAICDRYAERDARIRVIHKVNGGLSSARNAGLDVASGEFVCFVDSDDWVEATYVERLVAEAESAGAQIAVCGYVTEQNGRSAFRGFSRDRTMDSHAAVTSLYGRDYLILTVAWNKLFKRDLFARNRFREGMVHEDEQIIASLYLSASRVACFSEPLYHYRHRAASITDVQSKQISLDAIVAYEDRLALLRESSGDMALIQLTIRRLTRIVLSQMSETIDGRRPFAQGVTAADLSSRLQTYAPLVRPRYNSVALWSRFVLATPTIGLVTYSWLLEARNWAVRAVRRVSSAIHGVQRV